MKERLADLSAFFFDKGNVSFFAQRVGPGDCGACAAGIPMIDLRGLTELAATLSPVALIALLAAYHVRFVLAR